MEAKCKEGQQHNHNKDQQVDLEFKIHGVNGIWTENEPYNNTTDVLLQELSSKGYKTRDYNYPKMTALQAYSTRLEKKHARQLLAEVTPGDVAIGHSRGGLVIWRACKLGAQFSTIVLFAPAMDSDMVWPRDCAKKIVVIHDPRDKALALGKILPFHRFGTLGKYGYTGEPDPRIEHINAFEVANDVPAYSYDRLFHSHYFKNLNIWTPLVIKCFS